MNMYYSSDYKLLEEILLEKYFRCGLTDEIFELSEFIDKIFYSILIQEHRDCLLIN